MNFRLTLTMIIILTLLLAAYVGLRSHEQNAKPEEESTKNALLSPKPAEIKTITYSEDDQKQLSFDKSGSGWNMTYPTTAPANTFEVDPIADGLKGLSYKEKFEPEASGVHSPASTGTDKPRHVINFTDDAGRQHTLALGKGTIGGIYATLDSSKTIYLLANNPLDSLSQDPSTFRDRKVFETTSEKIESITLKRADQSITLTKSPDNKWLISTPLTARANHSTADEIINEIKNVRAYGFSDLAKTMPATGLNPPVLTITAMVEETPDASTTSPASQPTTGPKLKPFTLELGYYTDLTSKNAVYASVAGNNNVFTLGADAFNHFNKQLKDLRDPAITPAPVTQATEINVSSAAGGGDSFDLKKENNEWRTSSLSHNVKAGTGDVNGFLTGIANLRAINYVDNAGNLKSIGLDPAERTITLTIPNQAQKETILIGKPETADKVTPVMRQGEATVYLVQSAEVEKLVPTLLALRDKTIDTFGADAIRSIAVAGTSNFTLSREGKAWKVTKGNKTENADDAKVTGLLADFTPLTAQKYLAVEGKDKWHLPAKPDITVTITSQEPTSATTQATTLTAAPAGPAVTHSAVHTLNLYKDKNDWKAVWEGGKDPQWLFQPTANLVTNVTTATYGAPATQPPTQPAPEGAK